MSERVVTRFAPSPTGYLHVGGARTALFNWLWARRNGGTFILRIEDTDQKRNTPTAARQVMTDLQWLGIDWDEGPETGGPHGPYLQSQRTDLYDKYVRQLLDEGKAYHCFETAEELDAMRQEAEAQKTGFVYRRPENPPSEEQAQQARAEGRAIAVRFAVPQDQPIVVNDVVRGQISFNPAELADFIILKSDGFPTYNFACVVDDALMEVTHVIRGQEHLMNTPGQQALWQALFPERPLPQYAHMSVTVSDSGGKLSKRERPKTLRAAIEALQNPDLGKLAAAGGISTDDVAAFLEGKSVPDMPAIDAMAASLGVRLPEINIVDFFKSGYLPETMVNFLALLGWNPGDQREVMSVEELTEAFDLSRLTKSNSLFDRQKLIAFNTEHIRMVPKDVLLDHFKAYLEQVQSPLLAADDEVLAKVLELCEGARTLEQIDQKSRFLYVEDDHIEFDETAVKKVLLKGQALEVLQIVRDRLAQMSEYTEQALEDMLRGLAEERQVGLGKVAQPLRVALCGTTISLPIFDSVNLLGKQRTLTRIDATLKRFGAATKAESK
ncbi:MAG: glutamate--tRNA ligase [Sedimentisphaerales bacterium]|nr:glutamate--tRNA ligase [Sedimentisphaerales bacterium]